ncbi:MAG TPA: glycosyltransferase family 39 protein [Myxococcales bacterium]|nr:glycosyltransferase family 39 protein [Myxococcales bacterium]
MAPRRLLFAALAAALLVRVPALLLTTEHYGDGAVRVELAEKWARSPHLWRGFTETYQYGPLHLTLIGAALRAWPDRFWAPRLLSVVCGMLGIWLVFRVAQRFFGPQAAFVAALGLALSPLHIQASTTAASEAPFLALFLGSIDLLLADRLVASALLLAASGLVRYDGWLYVPLLAGWLFLRRVALSRVMLYLAIAVAPIVLWLWVNEIYAGDPLAPIHHIEWDHRMLTRAALAYFGQLRWRGYCLVYWPLAVLLVCTPVLGAFAIAGAARALWKRSAGWQIAALAWIPAAYFTFRAAVLMDFRPLSRFVLVAGVLSLPFAWNAIATIPPRIRSAVTAFTAATLVLTPAALALASYGRNGGLAEWARPLSPVSTVPPGIAQAIRWLRANAGPDDILLLDSAWHYLDIPLAFASGIPDDRIARLRWRDFDERLDRRPATLALLLYQGTLRSTKGAESATEESESFRYREWRFCRVEKFVYASIYRRCDASTAGR